jgi:hypothetical protein
MKIGVNRANPGTEKSNVARDIHASSRTVLYGRDASVDVQSQTPDAEHFRADLVDGVDQSIGERGR